MTTTAQQVVTSSEFLKIALPRAIQLVADRNRQSYDLTLQAFALGVDAVQQSVARLLVGAAQAVADDINQKNKA